MATTETIVKKHWKVDKKAGTRTQVESTYYVHPTFKPSRIDEISMEFIINYCKANKQTAWLKDLANENVETRKGKEIKTPFVTLRAEFAGKFFPEAVIGDKKKSTYLDIINAL
jgi:hypothetical protein